MSDEATAAPPPPEDPREILRRVQLSIQGAHYDLQHWSQLPPVVDGQSTLECVRFVTTRDGRGPYMLLLFAVVLILLCLACRPRSRTPLYGARSWHE